MTANASTGQAGTGQAGGSSAPKAAPAGGDASADWNALRGDVEDLASTAVERGRGFAAAARDQATTYVEQRKDDAVHSVSGFARALRESGANFDDRPNVKAFFDSAAEGLDQLAGSIERRSAADLYEDAEALARRSPAAVAAAAFTAGFLAARFVKASSPSQARRAYAGRRS